VRREEGSALSIPLTASGEGGHAPDTRFAFTVVVGHGLDTVVCAHSSVGLDPDARSALAVAARYSSWRAPLLRWWEALAP